MRKPGEKKEKQKRIIALKGGSYSLILTAVVLAILIVVNILVSVLPETVTKQDISSTKLYSVTSDTKAVVGALEQDVTIYWIVQADEEDSVIENLLAKYDSLSDHISVVKKNPDVYPTFAETYTDETVANNSLVIESGDKSRYVAYSDIYLTEIDYETYSYVYSFDGEGAITSAIDYVVSEELPKVYVLEGHGEADIPDELSSQMERENMEVESLSLLNVDEIPEDANCLIIYSPETDISEKERDLLSEYAAGGGKLLVMAGTTKDGSLDNLNSLLADYGVTPAEGIVIEEDRDHYAFGAPYVLLPDLGTSEITEPLISENYYVIAPIAQGYYVDESASESVTTLLSTSDTAFSKIAGYDLTTYDKEEGDLDGPFALAVSIDTGNEGQIIWIGAPQMVETEYNSYSSGANLNFTMNALSSLIGETEAVAIRSKSLSYNYLTIAESTAGVLKLFMIGIIPAAFVIIGIGVILNRRRTRNA